MFTHLPIGQALGGSKGTQASPAPAAANSRTDSSFEQHVARSGAEGQQPPADAAATGAPEGAGNAGAAPEGQPEAEQRTGPADAGEAIGPSEESADGAVFAADAPDQSPVGEILNSKGKAGGVPPQIVAPQAAQDAGEGAAAAEAEEAVTVAAPARDAAAPQREGSSRPLNSAGTVSGGIPGAAPLQPARAGVSAAAGPEQAAIEAGPAPDVETLTRQLGSGTAAAMPGDMPGAAGTVRAADGLNGAVANAVSSQLARTGTGGAFGQALAQSAALETPAATAAASGSAVASAATAAPAAAPANGPGQAVAQAATAAAASGPQAGKAAESRHDKQTASEIRTEAAAGVATTVQSGPGAAPAASATPANQFQLASAVQQRASFGMTGSATVSEQALAMAESEVPVETPGLSQLLAEASLSQSAVHRPETPRMIAAQLAEAFAAKGDRNVDVALNPEELGRVKMRVSASESGILVTIVTERPETGDLMRRHIGELAAEFRRMGYQDISFEFGGGSAGQAGQDMAGGDSDGSSRRGMTEASEPVAADAPAAAEQKLSLGAAGVDMRV